MVSALEGLAWTHAWLRSRMPACTYREARIKRESFDHVGCFLRASASAATLNGEEVWPVHWLSKCLRKSTYRITFNT